MDRQQVLLAKSLDASGVPLSVASFDERLILQKAVYLIQSAGIRLGYRFRWYIRGPYSPEMTADAFAIINGGEGTKEELKAWKLDETSEAIGRKLKPLLLRVSETTDAKARRFELLASTLFLFNTKQADPELPDETSNILIKNGKDFTSDDVRNAVSEMRKYGFIAQSS
ncbi:MAG: hypothetical protein U0798_17680 [Gemmataceae bacterium]